MAPITLTRQQLYDRAWEAPIEALAKELGLSGRGLGKLCRRHNIPVPPRGYWAKKAAGKRISQPALPESDERGNQRIGFLGASTPAAPDPNATDLDELIAFEKRTENHLTVPDSLPLTDERILKTQRLLARAKRGPAGLASVPSGALNIHTSREQHERALRTLQALVTAFEARGFPLADTEDGVTRVLILDEPLGFGIEEQTRTVEHRITFTEQKLIDRGYGYQVPKKDLVPSGDLTLLITNVHGVRHRWKDGSRRLEEMLNAFLVGFVRAALALKRQRAEAERLARERQEEERARQEEAKRQAAAAQRWREEKARVDRLQRLSAVWERNRRLRALTDQVKVALGDVDIESELGKWLAWAADYAERSDPLARLRDRTRGTLALYFYGYGLSRIPVDGFAEPEHYGGADDVKPGVELTDRPPARGGYPDALTVELPEDLVLPYEWPQDSNWYWRIFRVPAALPNRALGYGGKPMDDVAGTAFKVLSDDADND